MFNGEDSALTAIRAVSARYPLRGRLKVADVPFGPAREVDYAAGPGRSVARTAAVRRSSTRSVGDRVRVGSDRADDHEGARLSAGPGLAVRRSRADAADAPRRRAGDRSSRRKAAASRYAALFAGDTPQVAEFKEQLTARKKPGQRIVDVEEASPQIRSAIDRAGRFLNLAALVTILLAAIAVAIAARRYVARHLDTVALMKSMGASQRLVLAISVLELLMIAIVAGVLGALIGYAAQEGIAFLLRDLVRGELPRPALDRRLARAHDFDPDSDRLRVAAAPAAAQCAAGARAAAQSRAAAAALRRPSTARAIAALVALLYWLVRDPKLLVYVSAATLGDVRRADRRRLGAGARA